MQNDGEIVFSLIRRSRKSVYIQYKVNSDWNNITLTKDRTESEGQAAFEYLSRVVPGIYLKRGLLTLHAALVEHEGYAFAVCAPSGTGKTTHVRLWRDFRNALILNGDHTVLGCKGQDWIAYGIPWSGTSGEQINRNAPLKALIILERSVENSVEELEGIQAFARIFQHVHYPVWDRKMPLIY